MQVGCFSSQLALAKHQHFHLISTDFIIFFSSHFTLQVGGRFFWDSDEHQNAPCQTRKKGPLDF